MPKCCKQYKNKEKMRINRNKQRARNYDKAGTYPPRSWTIVETELVLEHPMTDRELSKQIERSVRAIQVCRARLKKDSMVIEQVEVSNVGVV